MSTDPSGARPTPPWQSFLGAAGLAGGRGQVPQDQLRISDADRQEIADQLGKHYADGRLDRSELDERVARAMSAKTRGDLRGLLDDLPPAVPLGVAPNVQAPSPPRGPHLHRLLQIAMIVLVAMAAGAALSMPWQLPWPLFLIVAFVLLRGPFRFRHHHHHHGPHAHGPAGGGVDWY